MRYPSLLLVFTAAALLACGSDASSTAAQDTAALPGDASTAPADAVLDPDASGGVDVMAPDAPQPPDTGPSPDGLGLDTVAPPDVLRPDSVVADAGGDVGPPTDAAADVIADVGPGPDASDAMVEDLPVAPDTGQDAGGQDVGGPDVGPACPTVEVVARDIWAQLLPDATVTVDDVSTGAPIALCIGSSVVVRVLADDHETIAVRLNSDGGGVWASLDATSAEGGFHLVKPGAQTYELHTGSVHEWYAASGRPARRGNLVTLLTDGEQAWGAVASDLDFADDEVHLSTWWWQSDFELVRDPVGHPTATTQQRYAETMIARLSDLPPWVFKRVLVNQFVGQDGLLDGVNVDDALTTIAQIPGDGFEMMGHFNASAGQFFATAAAVDFGARVGAMGVDGPVIASAGLPSFLTRWVDMADLPLGLSIFDIPHASWHQKFATIDDDIAYVGGMNIKSTDWDTWEHAIFEPRRMAFDATIQERLDVVNKETLPDLGPRKDYMVRLDGPLAVDVRDVFARRWEEQRAAGVAYSANATQTFVGWPVSARAGGIQAQVIATMPAPHHEYAILETLLKAVSRATTYILIEDQYFRAPILYDLIMARMQAVPQLKLIVVTNAVGEWSDPGCYQTHLANEAFLNQFPSRFRTYMLRSYDAFDTGCSFCVDEVGAYFADMDLHSKLVLIDDVFLETGSCNSNNRGLLYEGELAVAVHNPAWVRDARDEIFETFLGPDYDPSTSGGGLFGAMAAQAAANQAAYDAWDDEGFDLDLDGDPIPGWMRPSGFVYPLVFDSPDDCLLEGMGPDTF